MIEIAALILAVVPAALFLWNLRVFRRPEGSFAAPVSVLIPARNEEAKIEAAVRSVLAQREMLLEVVVLDDHSTDGTAAVVRRLAAVDSRVRLAAAPPLPPGWCGKQHACAVLAEMALFDVMLFMDADVRLTPGALTRMVSFLDQSESALISGFPNQETGSFLERLLLPMIHFVLLAFLPINRMRASTHPAYAAGCGQLMMVRRDAYRRAGGHAAIRASLHDGIQLPKAFRTAGFKTDIFDATDIATCRMYHGARQVWQGLAKNAVEGIGHPARIMPFTLILLVGQVAPFVLLVTGSWSWATVLAALAALTPRLAAARRFGQPIGSALLHPLGVIVLLAIQWYALISAVVGKAPQWKDRRYAVKPG